METASIQEHIYEFLDYELRRNNFMHVIIPYVPENCDDYTPYEHVLITGKFEEELGTYFRGPVSYKEFLENVRSYVIERGYKQFIIYHMDKFRKQLCIVQTPETYA